MMVCITFLQQTLLCTSLSPELTLHYVTLQTSLVRDRGLFRWSTFETIQYLLFVWLLDSPVTQVALWVLGARLPELRSSLLRPGWSGGWGPAWGSSRTASTTSPGHGENKGVSKFSRNTLSGQGGYLIQTICTVLSYRMIWVPRNLIDTFREFFIQIINGIRVLIGLPLTTDWYNINWSVSKVSHSLTTV